jgi:hypothetical protein
MLFTQTTSNAQWGRYFVRIARLACMAHAGRNQHKIEIGNLEMANCFPYADVNADSVEAVIDSVPMFSGTSTTPPKGLGFTLVKGTLIPNSLLDDVDWELHQARLNCYEVTKVADLFTHTFLSSLTASERDVLGECVLLLIEQGRIPISLIDKKLAAE